MLTLDDKQAGLRNQELAFSPDFKLGTFDQVRITTKPTTIPPAKRKWVPKSGDWK
jgi:hypothetical protein